MGERLVSVIMPTYKDKGGLERAIISVLMQSYKNIELIVVDDNAPDSEFRKHTENLMNQFLADTRVKYIKHKENKNGAAARNTGIKASKGVFIAFLDDDDWFLEKKIERQISYLDNHPEYAAVYNFAFREDIPIPTIPFEGDNSRPLLMMETHMYTPSLCFRADALKSIHGFDESFKRHQDYEMLLRFFAAGYKIGCLQEYLTGLCVNKGENIPAPEKMLQLKRYFFEKFNATIINLSKEDKFFKSKLYAKHYGAVAWDAIKAKKIMICLNLFLKYFWKSPKYFTLTARENISSYYTRKIMKHNNE